MKSLQYINSIIVSKKDIGLLVFRILIGIASSGTACRSS